MAAGRTDRLTFLGRPLPASFTLRVLAMPPGGTRAFDPAEWRDALVVVEHGALDLLGVAGGCHRLRRGDVACLDGLSLRTLRNPAAEPALVVAVSRKGVPPRR